MLDIDWRSPASYESVQDLDAVEFVWEFLRRNPDYQRDHDRTTETPPNDDVEMIPHIRRWELCLPCRSLIFIT